MSLPKWIDEDSTFAFCYMDGPTEFEKKLIKALTVAWEAMETIIANPSQKCTNEHDIVAQEAMKRIEDLGKEARGDE